MASFCISQRLPHRVATTFLAFICAFTARLGDTAPTVVVPDLVGTCHVRKCGLIDPVSTLQELQKAGLTVGTVTGENDAKRAGTVLSQLPLPNALVPLGTAVNLVVANDAACGTSLPAGVTGAPRAEVLGVPALSNGAMTGLEDDCGDYQTPQITSLREDDEPYGDPFQCVEYVRRFYAIGLGEDTTYASWPGKNARLFYYEFAPLGLARYANAGDPVHADAGVPTDPLAGTIAPRANDILVFDTLPNDPLNTKRRTAGHVAVIQSVGEDHIVVVEQNNSRNTGERRLTLDRSAGTFAVKRYVRPDGTPSSYTPLGWLRVPDFSDRFDRADGLVGNAWVPSPDNVNSSMVIRSGALSVSASGGYAGIYRPMDTSKQTLVSATITGQSGLDGLLQRQYETSFYVGSTGKLRTGYGVLFARSGENDTQSRVVLLIGDTEISRVYSTFQYGALIDVSIAFEPNGRVRGSVAGDGQVSYFDFALFSPMLPGASFGIFQGVPNHLLPAPTFQTIDNITLTSVATATAPVSQPVLTVTDTNMVPVKIVRSGTTVLLGWNTNNGDESSCSLTGAGVPSGALTNGTGDSQTGSVPVIINAQTTFTLTCGTQTVTKRIDIIPIIGEG